MTLSEPQKYVLTTTQSINLFLAGVGSGKTHLGGIISGYLIEKFPQARGFIAANTHEQLNTSTLSRVREVWRDVFGWVHGVDYVMGIKPPKNFKTENHNFDRYDNIISFKNGAVVFKGSLERAKVHDGKQFCWALLDETKDSREEDVKEVILTRLREMEIYINEENQLINKEEFNKKINSGVYQNLDGKIYHIHSLEEIKAFNPLYILTSPAKVDWLNDWFSLEKFQTEIEAAIYSETNFFRKEFDDKCVAVSSTFHNKINLPSNFIKRVLDNNSEDMAKMLIYANPFSKVGGEFYSGFSRIRNTEKVKFNPSLPIHITFDQNVAPYITMCCWQVVIKDNITYLYQFDEFCLENPNNTTERVCEAFLKKYSGAITTIYYYGDPSGKKRSTRGHEHDYQIVARVLSKYINNKSNMVRKRHPSVIKRRDFINNIFVEKYEDIRIKIDPENCPFSVKDYVYLKQDPNGKKLKKKEKDNKTGAMIEKYGHTSDANDYFITVILKDWFNRFRN